MKNIIIRNKENGKPILVSTPEMRKTNERIKDMNEARGIHEHLYKYMRRILVVDLGEQAVKNLGL